MENSINNGESPIDFHINVFCSCNTFKIFIIDLYIRLPFQIEFIGAVIYLT